MMFFSAKKINKSWLVIGCMVLSITILVVIFMGYWTYQDMLQAKQEHSSTLQVVKPVQNDSFIAANATDFFMEYRLERDKLRSERSELLRENIKNAQNEDTRQRSQDAILKLILEKQRESEMEGLIKARGFGDALVIIRDNSVNAVIKTASLSKEEVIQIADIISRISGVKAEDIVISAKP